MPDDDDINMKRHLRGYVDKDEWLSVTESTSEKDVIRYLSKVYFVNWNSNLLLMFS